MKKIYFYFPVGETLTGQELATRIILKSVSGIFECDTSFIPVFNRERNSFFYKFKYAFFVFLSWGRILKLLFVRSPKVYLNLSQTAFSLFRDGFPFMVLKFCRPGASIVISLHGHVFTTWSKKDKICSSFTAVLKCADLISVLGDVQRLKLLSFGIPDENVIIVNNTCDIEPTQSKEISAEVKLLYLSNLMEEKGFREYLLALQLLSKEKLTKKVSAVLCGKLFGVNVISEKDIQLLINDINSSDFVKVRWEQGAYGKDKRRLFSESDIFIFPSKYNVEAQPIVLIEAMASSCAVIATKVGEIPSTLSSENTIFLESADEVVIKDSILTLVRDNEKLLSMQSKSYSRFKEFFSSDIYKKTWIEVFERL